MENVYKDLLYFGNDHLSQKCEEEFIAEIKQRFPNVELRDAYNNIKGYRQEVHLPEEENDNYWTWLFAFGWFGFSLIGQLEIMPSDDLFNKYAEMVKIQYPEKSRN